MTDASARRERARHLSEAKRHDLAERELREALALDPEDGDSHAALAWCLHELERTPAALEHARAALAAQPGNARFHQLHAALLERLGRGREALAAIGAARRLAPEDAAIHGECARINLALGNWRTALEACDRSLALQPQQGDVHGMRTMALIQLDRARESEAAAATALAAEPDALVPHLAAAWAHLNAGRWREAEAGFREALRLDPGNASARSGFLASLRLALPLARLPDHVARPLAFIGILGLPALAWSVTSSSPVPSDPWLRWTAVAFTALCLLPFATLPLSDAWVCRSAVGRSLLQPDQRRSAALMTAAALGAVLLAGRALATGGLLAPALAVALLAVPISFSTHPANVDHRRIVGLMMPVFIAGAALVLAVHGGAVAWPAHATTICYLWAVVAWLLLAPNLFSLRSTA